jgi:hypothetical protein
MGVEPTTTCLEGRGSTAELLPQNRIYFTPKNALRQRGVPAWSKTSPTDHSALITGYRLCARTEGKSQRTIDAVIASVGYLDRFLRSEGLTTDAATIGPPEIRAFILYLQQKRCFSGHPFVLLRFLASGFPGFHRHFNPRGVQRPRDSPYPAGHRPQGLRTQRLNDGESMA